VIPFSGGGYTSHKTNNEPTTKPPAHPSAQPTPQPPQGNKVRVLTRDVTSAKGKLPFPGLEFFAPGQWAGAVAGADAVVNLAGTPIGTR
jgi:hypothetical protein